MTTLIPTPPAPPPPWPIALSDLVTGVFEKTSTWIAILVTIAVVVFLFRDFLRCHRLLKATRVGKLLPQGNFAIGLTIVGIAFTDGTIFAIRERKLIRRVRMRVEHEMFPPTPQVDVSRFAPLKSLKKIDKAIAGIDWSLPGAKRYEIYLRALATWSSGLSRIHEVENQTIKVTNAAEVNAHFTEMNGYFDLLKTLKVKQHSKHFVCSIEISQGFITPLLLVTGLLIEFNQKWGNVLSAFNRDAGLPSASLGKFGGDLREIQMFIYTCWLLWGPSIPVCGCSRSDARFRTIQYGFGDENNSLEVVGAAALIDEAMRDLLSTAQRHLLALLEPSQRATFSMPMALPTTVRGRLRLSNTIGTDPVDTDALSENSMILWGGGADPRPVLYLSTIESSDAAAGPATYQSIQLGRLAAAQETVRSRYYSAYLWIAFVMMEEDTNGVFLPLSRLKVGQTDTQAEMGPWTDIVPFFEHGNLADPQSCNYGKDQLAAKVAEALVQLFQRLPTDSRTRFVFACSIDDAGCGPDAVFPGWQGGKLIRDRVMEKIDTEAGRGHDGYIALKKSGIVIFKPGDEAWRAAHEYTACGLPRIVDAHYEDMEAKADQAA